MPKAEDGEHLGERVPHRDCACAPAQREASMPLGEPRAKILPNAVLANIPLDSPSPGAPQTSSTRDSRETPAKTWSKLTTAPQNVRRVEQQSTLCGHLRPRASRCCYFCVS